MSGSRPSNAPCLLAAALVAVAVVGASAAPPALVPWAPPDADLVVRARNLADVWPALAQRPFAVVLRAELRDSELGAAWSRLADSLGRDSADLAIELLGTDATCVIRRADDRTEWVLLAVTTPETRRAFASRATRALGGGVFELVEQELRIAERGEAILLGGVRGERLWQEVLTRLEDPPGEEPRRSMGRFERPRWMPVVQGASIIEAFASEAIAQGEAFIAVGELDAEGLSAEIRPIESSPRSFDAGARLVVEAETTSLLDRLRSEHLAVVLTVQGVGLPWGDEWLALLPEASPTPALGDAARRRRLWILGETRGGAGDPWPTLQTPAIAHAIEVGDASEALPRMRRWSEFLAEAILRRLAPDGGAASLVTPEGGVVTLRGWLESLLGDHPLAARLSIDWGTVAGRTGEWVVIASGGPWLRSILGSLEDPRTLVDHAAEADAASGAVEVIEPEDDLVQSGWVRADRVARHLEGWVRHGEAFADPEARGPFEARWTRAASMLRTIDEVRWEVRRTPSGWHRTSIRIETAGSAASTSDGGR